VETADLIVAFGTRLGDIATDGYTMLDVPRRSRGSCISMPTASNWARLPGRAADPCRGGAGRGDARIAAAASAGTVEVVDGGARADHEAFVTPPKPHSELSGVNMSAAISHLNSVLPEDSVDQRRRQLCGLAAPLLRLQAPPHGTGADLRRWAMPAAIAAKLRHPEKTVVCLAGDGCFLMYPQEIATAAAHGVNLIVVVVNNRMYGTIRMHQERRYPGRQSGTTIVNPDFVGMARLRRRAERVEKTEDFAAAFERARNAGKPAVLELLTDPLQITPAMRVTEMPT
jgi:acetolactate synthase-1/2/3 large subunit